ncbi:hypothetical protein L1887_44096 [Cichorium endivia]|nr:hypothetical protein L1887_44096 [Cichorium endivia]
MSKDTTSEHLRAELKSLADTLEEVLNSSADKSKEEVSKLRSKAEQALKESRYRLGETGDALAKQTREAAARADEYVHPRHAQGPANNVLGIGQRILTTLVGIAETRVRLAVVELEEEKANLFQMLLMLGLTMLFAAFGLMSLMVLIIWAIDPQYRLNAMIATTVVLLVAALIGGIWTLRKARKSTFLRHTRQELANDRALLEDDKP